MLRIKSSQALPSSYIFIFVDFVLLSQQSMCFSFWGSLTVIAAVFRLQNMQGNVPIFTLKMGVCF